MLTVDEIRKDLLGIRYYYSRKSVFDNSGIANEITNTVKRYNEAVRTAEPRLFDLYVCLYIKNQTQEGAASELCWSTVYVQRLHTRLVLFFQTRINKEGGAVK